MSVGPSVERIITAINQQPCGDSLLVAVDLNSNVEALEGNLREEDIKEAMENASMEDMNAHFLPQCKSWAWYGQKCYIHRQRSYVCSRKDYFLGMDLCMFQNVSVQDSWHNSDHNMFLGCLRGAAKQ